MSNSNMNYLLLINSRQNYYYMGLFFWDFTDYNDIERQWAMFIVNTLALIFTTYSLVKTSRLKHKPLFELLPLSINTIATLILFFIKLFEKGYEFDMVGYSIEIYTYFLFCYTFSVMHSKITEKKSWLSKVCNVLLLFFALSTVVIIILILSTVIAKDCDNNLIEASLAGFVTEFICYVPTMYFGFDIIKNLDRKNKEEMESSSELSDSLLQLSSIKDQYIQERKKQIKLVLSAFTISLFLRAVVLGFNFNSDDYFNCFDCEGVKIITSDLVIGQIILVLVELNQLIPHLVIPIALYVIPAKLSRKTTQIDIKQTLLSDSQLEDEQLQQNDYVQRRISTSILKRSISSPEVKRSVNQQ